MFLVRLAVNSSLLFKFMENQIQDYGESKVLHEIFTVAGVWGIDIPNPHVAQGSTVYEIHRDYTYISFVKQTLIIGVVYFYQ